MIMPTDTKGPLDGITVIDFTTLAPGPFATLILANAGADVVKIERPGVGDEMRIYQHAFGDNGVTFAILNAGKRSVTADLKDPNDLERIKAMIQQSDVVVEQFRPGVMSRLGLGYEQLSESTPGLVYCSITGFGQDGPKAMVAAHDLNYVADTGMLALGNSDSGKPSIPQLLAADLAGGSYPAVVNILLALQRRQFTGNGAYIDISMTDCLFPLMFWGLGLGWGSGEWPHSGNQLLTGGSPRYQVYRTLDNCYLAVAALEQRFWEVFCDTIQYRADAELERRHSKEMIREIEQIILSKTADQWTKLFEGKDACSVIANTLEEAVQDAHYRSRGVFDRKIETEDGAIIDALPLPVVPDLMDPSPGPKKVPALGEHN